MKFVLDLSAEQVREHVVQTHPLWGGGLDLEARLAALVKRMRESGPNLMRMQGLVDVHGTLVASLKRYTVDLILRGRRTSSIGIGAVFTHPDHRKAGHAARLLRHALSQAHEGEGFEHAFLFTDIGPEYYERLGFRSALPAEDFSLMIPEWPTSQPALAMTPATERDLAFQLQQFEQCTNAASLRCARTERTWPLMHELNGISHVAIVSGMGQPVGSLSWVENAKRGYLWLEEWLAPPDHEAALWSTIRSLAERQGLREIRGWNLPHYHLPPAATRMPRAQALPMVVSLGCADPVSLEDLGKSYFAGPDHF